MKLIENKDTIYHIQKVLELLSEAVRLGKVEPGDTELVYTFQVYPPDIRCQVVLEKDGKVNIYKT